MQRIRLIYSKGEELRYTGNLDMQKVWERTFRRANLHLAYSQGFHPQPRIHQACPLPLGFTSSGEILDFWLDFDETIPQIQEKLEKALQPGISIKEYQSIPLDSKPLQTLVISAAYDIQIEEDALPVDFRERIERLMQSPQCMRERRGKKYDLLPLIESLQVIQSDQAILHIVLTARPAATGRPEEVLDALGIPLQDTVISRTALILST